MKGCELCPGTARMFCESDQASLCFECDGKVHGANFLVARHSRVLLCRSCQAPTPWKAAGPRLCPTVSVCDLCVSAGGRSKKNNGDDDEDEGESAARERIAEEEDDDHQEEDVDDEELEEDDDDDDDDEMESDDGDDDDDDEEEEEEEEEEEGEEQVVPWSTEPLPPVASSCSSEEEPTVAQRFNGNNNNNNNGFLKRNRWGNVDPHSSSCNQDQMPCSSTSCPSYVPNPSRTALSNHPAAQTMAGDDEATSDSFRPSKDRKKSDLVRSGSRQLSAISFGSGRPPI